MFESAISYARLAMIVLLMPLALYCSIVYPFVILWFIKSHWIPWIRLYWKIRRKLSKRTNFSLFRSRYARCNSILWKLEGGRIYRVFWIMLFLHVPFFLAIALCIVLNLLR